MENRELSGCGFQRLVALCSYSSSALAYKPYKARLFLLTDIKASIIERFSYDLEKWLR